MTISPTPPPVLVTGATGLIRARLDRALTDAGALPRFFGRNVTGDGNRRGDIRDADAVFYAADGCGTIIHCASYTGTDPTLQQQINIEGTKNLLHAARLRGIRRFLYLSTAGIYGGVLGHGRREGYIKVQPGSSSTQSRAIADLLVREHGGTVIRPNLVYGTGDTTTIPPLLAAMTHLGAWIGNPGALVSTISTESLGQLIACLALTNHSPGTYHAAFPVPITVSDFLSPIYEHVEMAGPNTVISAEEAAKWLAPAGVSSLQIAMVASDNWFNSDAIWKATDLTPPHPSLNQTDLEYYGTALRAIANASN